MNAPKNIRRVVNWSFTLLIIALGVTQGVPMDRANPSVEGEVSANLDVRAVLQRAGYDCHSNETVWPSYSRIAPISWLVASDVHEGREALSCSTWNRLTDQEQAKEMHEIGDEAVEGAMPPWLYRKFHPGARLSEADRSVLETWSRSMSGGESVAR